MPWGHRHPERGTYTVTLEDIATEFGDEETVTITVKYKIYPAEPGSLYEPPSYVTAEIEFPPGVELDEGTVEDIHSAICQDHDWGWDREDL